MRTLFSIFFISTSIFFTGIATAGECTVDNDCKGDRVCHENECMSEEAAKERELLEIEEERAALEKEKSAHISVSAVGVEKAQTGEPQKSFPKSSPSDPTELSMFESGLIVVLEEDLPGAVLFIDGKEAGPLPYEGKVEPGKHTLQVKRWDKEFPKKETRIEPQRTRHFEFSKENLNNQFDTGIFYVGVIGAIHGSKPVLSERAFEYPNKVFGGAKLVLGFQIIQQPIWLELGLTEGLFFTSEQGESAGDWAVTWSGFLDINTMGIFARVLFNTFKPWFYFGLELEGGISRVVWKEDSDESKQQAFGPYFNPKLSLSLFLNDWIEFRFSPAGFSYTRVPFKDDGYLEMLSYTAELGFVLRI